MEETVEAVICPVCKGEGQICMGIDRNSTSATPILKPCHGCDGKGYVVIPDDKPEVTDSTRY